MRKTWLLTALVLAVLATASLTAVAAAGGRGDRDFEARLSGFNEVPAISTAARGRFELELHSSSIEFELRYEGLTGTVTQAHIHFAQRSANGGVVAFLCGGGSKPACPPSGTVTGTIAATAADVGSSPEASAQGLTAGEFAELVRAIRAERTYANVHSSNFGGGEIRGQIEEDD
jgi:hypothetical protein